MGTRRRWGWVRPARAGLALSALALATLGAAGCGSSLPRLDDADVQRWLTAVQGFSNVPDEGSLCYLLTEVQLRFDVSHPKGAWTAEGFNDQTGDGRGFFGCSIRSATGVAGDGEIGIELTSVAGQDTDPATRQVVLPGTRWTLYEAAWPGRTKTSSAELERVEHDVVLNLSIAPPTSPSDQQFAGPGSPVS